MRLRKVPLREWPQRRRCCQAFNSPGNDKSGMPMPHRVPGRLAVLRLTCHAGTTEPPTSSASLVPGTRRAPRLRIKSGACRRPCLFSGSWFGQTLPGGDERLCGHNACRLREANDLHTGMASGASGIAKQPAQRAVGIPEQYQTHLTNKASKNSEPWQINQLRASHW